METMPEFDTFQIKPTHLEEPEDNGIVSSDSAGNRGEVTSGASQPGRASDGQPAQLKSSRGDGHLGTLPPHRSAAPTRRGTH